MVKNLPAMWEIWVWSLGWEDPWEKGMATHSSFLAWRIPRTEEPGGLQPMGSQRVGHDWTERLLLSDVFWLSPHFFKKKHVDLSPSSHMSCSRYLEYGCEGCILNHENEGQSLIWVKYRTGRNIDPLRRLHTILMCILSSLSHFLSWGFCYS